MVAGLWCAGLGFSNEAVSAAVFTQLQTLPFYHGFLGKASRPAIDLAEKLAGMSPDPLTRVLFASSGSEAVDTAVKLVSYYNNALGRTSKKKIIAREQSYHGAGTCSAALTAMEYCHYGFDVPEDRVLRTGSPSHYGCAESGESEIEFSKRRARELDKLITDAGSDTVGAFIAEPVQGSGGVVLPPEGYWAEIQNVLAKHDVLLIADEIICGFHRTGRPFGCNTYDIRPDIMTVAKQLSAGFIPISAVLISEEIYQSIADTSHSYGTFGYGFTYSGHPVAAAAALEALAEYERQEVPARVNRLAPCLESALAELRTEAAVGDVRSIGLMGGIELDAAFCETRLGRSAADVASAIVCECEERGVILRTAGSVIAICPPMIAGENEIAEMMEALRGAIRGVTA